MSLLTTLAKSKPLCSRLSHYLGASTTKISILNDSLLNGDNFQIQNVRYAHGIHAHKKPRWMGIAKSKMYQNPPKNNEDQSSITQSNILKLEYHDHLSAISQYLYEDFLKSSDVGDAAIIQAKNEIELHKKLVAENEQINAEVLKRREERIARELEEEKQRIKQYTEEQNKQKEMAKLEAEQKLQQEIEDLKNFVPPENFVEAINKALDNPIDVEYAIDTDGNIYRGRYTQSLDVPEDKREKIPLPYDPYDFFSEEQKEQEQEK